MQPRTTPAEKSKYVQRLYISGSLEKNIVTITGYSPGTVKRYAAPAKRAFALELFKFGFIEREIAAQTGYEPETVKRLLISSYGKDVLRITEYARLGQGIKAIVNYHSGQGDPKERTMAAFRKVKLPQIIAQATKTLNLGVLAEPPKDSYEILLFDVMHGGFPDAIKLGHFSFDDYIRSKPQEVSVDGLVAYLRQGIVSRFRDVLKFPVYVDREGIEAAIESLTPREKDVIRKIIFEGRTLKQVAGAYQVTRERIRQNEAKAIRKLSKQPVFMLAVPERLYERVKGLEATVEEQRKGVQARDAAIARYEERYGQIFNDSKNIDSELKMKLDIPIDQLELSTRAYIGIRNSGATNVGTLVQETENELLNTKNFGRVSLNEVKQLLSSMGLHLGMRLPPKLAIYYLI